MSKRTKSKLRDFRIFLSKEVFNGRYIFRNILITTIIATVVATVVGMTVLTGGEVSSEVQVEKPVPQSYAINSIDTEVINVDSINYLLADLDASSQAGIEANETIVVSGANTVKGKVIDNDVFVRAEASYLGEVVATAYLDEEYTVDESKSDDEWVCVVLEDGNIGYINSMFISIEKPEAEGEIVEVSGDVTETATESGNTDKPAQETGTIEKIDETPEYTGTITETPSTTESTAESTTESNAGSSSEPTTEETTEQATTDKPFREDAIVSGGVPVAVTYRSPISLSEEDINLMAAIVTLESGGESYDGQLAVANVIINRMQSGHWGSTVSDVVYAPYQFSCTSSPMLDYYLANGAQASSRQAVEEALSGVNNIGNYMCFKAVYAVNLGSYSVYSVIGNHVFH